MDPIFTALHAMNTAKRPGGYWLSVSGQMVFPVYGASGGIAAMAIAYLFSKTPFEESFGFDLGTDDGAPTEKHGGKWIAVKFPIGVMAEEALSRVEKAIEILYA